MILFLKICTLGLSLIGICIFLYIKISKYNRKKESNDWLVGDLICVEKEDKLLKLNGWSENSLYVEIKGINNKISWSQFLYNKSAMWRRNWNECKEYMGDKEPGFSPDLENRANGLKINGTPVEFLTEIECDIFLKQALKEENYELADAIRKRMERFR